MCVSKLLVYKAESWSVKKAQEFHNNSFPGHPSEDLKYIWESHGNDWLLYRDSDAKLFANNGVIYKVSTMSRKEDWEAHRALFDITSIPIEIPIKYEDLGKFKYTVVQRPYNVLGISLSETVVSGNLDENYLRRMVDNHKLLFKDLSKLGKGYPIPPKWCDSDVTGFWTDFKYWKYSKEEYVEFYTCSINKILENFNLNFDKDDINLWN